MTDIDHGHCKARTCYNRIQINSTCSRCGGPVTFDPHCCETRAERESREIEASLERQDAHYRKHPRTEATS